MPGTYGTILATLRHIIYCEIDALERLLGREQTDPWGQLGETTGLDALIGHAALLATDWETFLAGAVDSERPLPPDEGTNTIPAGIVIAVVLYHGNEHRGQVCTIISAHGHEAPDLTPWACLGRSAARADRADAVARTWLMAQRIQQDVDLAAMLGLMLREMAQDRLGG